MITDSMPLVILDVSLKSFRLTLFVDDNLGRDPQLKARVFIKGRRHKRKQLRDEFGVYIPAVCFK